MPMDHSSHSSERLSWSRSHLFLMPSPTAKGSNSHKRSLLLQRSPSMRSLKNKWDSLFGRKSQLLVTPPASPEPYVTRCSVPPASPAQSPKLSPLVPSRISLLSENAPSLISPSFLNLVNDTMDKPEFTSSSQLSTEMIPPVFTEEPVSEEAIASTSSLVSDRALPTPPMTNATTEVMQLKAIPTEIHLLFAASPDHPLNESVPSSQPDTTMTIVTPPAVETEPETVINLSQLPSLAVPELTLSTEDDRFVTSPVEMSQEPSQETDNDDSFVYPTDTTVWVVPAHSHPSMAPGAYKKWMAEQLDEHTPPLTAPLARRLTPKRSKSFAERSMSIVSSELPVIETIMDKEEGNSSSSSLEDEATKSDETLVNTEELMSVRTLEDIPEQQAVSAPVVVVVEEEVEDLTRIPSSATLDRLIKAKKEVLARKELSIETPAFTTTSSSTSTKKMGFFAKALGAFKPPTRDSPRPSNIPESTLYLRSPSSTLPARLPLDQERYVYRLSHLKLSQPKPLVDQILITNMMLQIVAVNDNVTLSRGIQGIRKRMRRRGSGIGKPRSPMGVMERSGRHGAHLSPSRVLVTVPAPAQSSMSWRRSQPQVSVADSDSDSEETKVPVVVIPPRGKSLSPPPFIQSFGPRTPGRSNNHRKSTVTVETEEEDEIPLGLLKA